ncbi:response regulator transcription factor [Streptococcus sp. DD12]|uniref:response regulator transcription factor n=1 Tax=Streptococcus sp. DD12 TaxID=1777880 RepID=UPI000798642C|nr:response regulator transcription factor [Streptococcus sp. DD12]KXT76591.1 Regulation of D-alanyl-lipoteichoic acid biosynthesis, DltR [Streptococcus sp. DD12]
MRILFAEDEAQMSRVVTTALSHEGYVVDAVFDGQKAVDLSQAHAYDVVILDIMMPKKTGLEALKEIRASGNTSHIIMLTAMAEIDDRVLGLDAGADDYLTKPFSLKELLARLRSMNRRQENLTPSHYCLGNLTLDVVNQELKAENSVRLSSKESKLLTFLLQNHDKVLSTNEIFRHVWSDTTKDDPATYVYMYISYLRQKLQAVQANSHITGENGGDFCLSTQE